MLGVGCWVWRSGLRSCRFWVTGSLTVLLGEVVLEFAVDEAVATADALEEAAFGTVIEKSLKLPRCFSSCK